jgi:hypothetical protein
MIESAAGSEIGPIRKIFIFLVVDAGGMTGQEYTGTSIETGELELHGSGHWTRLLGQPAAVPEPAAVFQALVGVSLAGLALARRRPGPAIGGSSRART